MKFNDFFKPRWKNSDPKIRNEAIKELTEEYNLNDLKDIVLTDAKPENQKQALKKISDEKALSDISQSSQHKAIKDQATKRLNEIWLKQLNTLKDEKSALDILARMTDQKVLEELVLNHKNQVIRSHGLSQITNGNTYYKVALNERNEALAIKAFEKVSKELQFKNLAKKANCKAVRLRAASKLDTGVKPPTTDDKNKVNLAKLELICNSFEALINTSDFKSAAKSAEDYTNSWESIFTQGLGDTLNLERRYHSAKKEFEEKLQEYQKAQAEKVRAAKTTAETMEKRKGLLLELENLSGLKDVGEKDKAFRKIKADWKNLDVSGTEVESELIKKFEESSSRLFSEIKERDKNLTKDELIESTAKEFKDLLTKEMGEQDYKLFADLKEKWASLKVDAENPLHEEYPTWVTGVEERLANYESQQGELQKEAFQKMRKILEKIEELNNKSDILSAEKDFKQALQSWNTLDKFEKVSEDLQEEYNALSSEFQQAKDKFTEAQEWIRWANLNKKKEIYENLKEAYTNISDEKELFAKLRNCQAEWKSIGPVSWDKSKELWDNYQNLVDDIYEKCQEYFEELVAERKSNLLEKENLCVQVETYIEEDKIKESSDTVKEIQSEWKNIGPVPRENSEEIWTRFKTACDKFFLLRNEQFQIVDGDKEENYRKKLELVELAESLQDSTEWKKTGDLLKKAQTDWKEIGPVPKEKMDELWEKFREPCDKFFNARDVYFKNLDAEKEKNLEKKEGLIQKLDELATLEDDTAKYNFIKNIQAEWKAIGPVDKNIMNEIWERFRKPIDEFFEERKEKFAQDQEVREENFLKKEELCLKAEKISESNQWKTTSEELKALQAEWKEIGPAPRDKDRVVWERFRAACDGFFNRMKDYYKQMDDQREVNLRIKEDLVFQAEDLAGFVQSGEDFVPLENRNWNEATEMIKSFQKKWKQTGPVPKNKSDELWNKFRMACDYVFDVARVASVEGAFDLEANLKAKQELCEDAEIISNQVHTDAQIDKIKDLQREWKQIGPVPKEDYAELWKRFRKASELVYREDIRLKV